MKSKLAGRHGNAPFTLDTSHIQAARDAGLLRPETIQVRSDRSDADFGVAYDRQDNIGTDVFDSQKAIQSRFERFALQCGFQLFVKHSSVKPNNSGNAKYNCKLLNDQQFCDSKITSANIEFPFYLNVYGVNGKWKLTKASFCHNHIIAKPLHAFHLHFFKLSELLSEKRQVAASTIIKRGITRLVDVQEDMLKELTEASKKCKFIPCMEGSILAQFYLVDMSIRGLSWIYPPKSAHVETGKIQNFLVFTFLYDSSRLSVAHFCDTYNYPFRPWPTDVTLKLDKLLSLPAVAVSSPEKGKRGLKPGTKPKHKRKKSKGET
uniref:MULE transposase domain-containing protein n=1 Tax=Globisporangium ultimum (strain ATCC 200006 / CBS 805.95 / DAOM BR144) TaxID=431595 RepID=K3WNN6_GLOUD